MWGGARTRWLLVTGMLALCAPRAWAQSSDAAAAEALFNEGIELLDKGLWRAACERFEASYSLDAATGTLHHLGDCERRRGRLASAWATYRRVADEAEHAGNRARLKLARDAAAELTPRLPKLSIHVPSEALVEGFRLERDGRAIDVTVSETPVPLDPGEHHIAASAPGHVPWSTTVVLEEGQTLEQPVPKLARVGAATESVASAPAPPAPGPAASPADLDPTGSTEPAPEQAGIPLWAWPLAGGVATGAAAITLLLVADAEYEDLAARCRSEAGCTEADKQASPVPTLEAVAVGCGIASGLLLGTAAVLFLTDGDADHQGAGLSVQAGPGAVTIRGRF